jgi:hypothetical protein
LRGINAWGGFPRIAVLNNQYPVRRLLPGFLEHWREVDAVKFGLKRLLQAAQPDQRRHQILHLC